MKISISLKSATLVAESYSYSTTSTPLGRAFVELRQSIESAAKPKRSVVARKKVTAKRRREKSKDTKSIRSEVMARADGVCECGCGMGFDFKSPAQLDHQFGRVRAKQSVANCWALRADCHLAKTRNRPSAEWWLQKFAKHAEKHGYHEEFRTAARRLRSLEIQAEAAR